VAALAAAARVAVVVVAEVRAEVQEAGAAKVAAAVDESPRRSTKSACGFKGNPLKRLKYMASHIAYKKFQSQSIQGKSK
jgi:hypothetical protein